MDNLLRDIRYGIRGLVGAPGFSIVALLALVLGIGVNTTTFSAIDATMFHPFSFANQDRLVMLWESNPQLGRVRGSVAPGNMMEWREQNKTLDQVVPITGGYFDLTDRDQPERFQGNNVASNFFDTLGVSALHGRTFTTDEGEPGREQVVVLKHSLWEREFGADPNVINQTIRLNGKTYTIVGVMPPDFNYPFNGGELWTPMVIDDRARTNRGSHFLQVMGLLKPGATINQAREDLNAIASRAAEQFPQTNAGLGVNVVSLTADATRGSRMYSTIMLGAVGFVLLIACANVANLLLVRGASRQKEMAIRLALGATRGRLVRQLLTESVLLSLAGGALGLLASVWGMAALAGSIPDEFSKFIPGWRHLGINRNAFLFTLLVSLATGLLFGLAPAIQTSKTNFNSALKEGTKGASSKAASGRARNVLVITEVALSLVLLIGAGLMIRSFIEMLRSDFGVDPRGVLTMQAPLGGEKYSAVETRINFYDQLLRRVEALPGVAEAAAVGNLPMGGSNNGTGIQRIGQTVFEQGRQPSIAHTPVTPRYLAAIGTRLIKGRDFTEQDRADSPRVALVNEAFVKQFLPGADPIGQTFKEFGGQETEIIGLTASVMNDDFEERRDPTIYKPYTQQTWWAMWLVIRGTADPAMLASAVRGEVSALDKTLPVFEVKPMAKIIDERMSPKRLATFMMLGFALLALVLAAVGIYAVMSYAVAQRTHEIGIRMALGARPQDIFRLVVGQGARLTLVGMVIGLGGAFAMTRAMSGVLYGVAPTDAVTFVGISLLLGGVALVACFVPTRRATRVDPMTALRCE